MPVEDREAQEERRALKERNEQLADELREKEKRWQRTVDRLQRQIADLTQKNQELQDRRERHQENLVVQLKILTGIPLSTSMITYVKIRFGNIWLDGGNRALVRVLVKTNIGALKTLYLKAFWSLKIALTKARLLKHDLPVHSTFLGSVNDGFQTVVRVWSSPQFHLHFVHCSAPLKLLSNYEKSLIRERKTHKHKQI